MTNNFVSIIVAVYNVEEYLEACLNSIVVQTYSHFELLLVNDGSTDNSGCICDKWQKKDSRIKVLHQENEGPSVARNRALKEMQGEYVLFVDSDDVMTPTMLALLVRAIGQDDVQLVCCGTQVIYHANEDKMRSDEKFYHIGMEGVHSFSYKEMCGVSVNLWNKFYRADIIRENNIVFPAGVFYEDVAFNWVYYCYCNRVMFIPEKLYCYHRRKGSIMGLTYCHKSIRGMDHLKIAQCIYDEYKRRKIVSEIYFPYFVVLFINLYRETFKVIPESCYREARERANILAKELMAMPDYRFISLKLKHKLTDIMNGVLSPQSMKMRHFFQMLKALVR